MCCTFMQMYFFITCAYIGMISNIHYNKIYIQYAYSEKWHKYAKKIKKQLWSYCIPILDYFGLAASCCLVSLHSTQTYMYQLKKNRKQQEKHHGIQRDTSMLHIPSIGQSSNPVRLLVWRSLENPSNRLGLGFQSGKSGAAKAEIGSGEAVPVEMTGRWRLGMRRRPAAEASLVALSPERSGNEMV